MSTLENWNVNQQYPLLTPEGTDLITLNRGTLTGKAPVSAIGVSLQSLAALGVYPVSTVVLTVADILCGNAINNGGLYTVTVASGGTGYAVDERVDVNAAGAELLVTSETGGVVTGVRVALAGDSYAVSSGVATNSFGAGTGLTVNIVAVSGPPILVPAVADAVLWPVQFGSVYAEATVPLSSGGTSKIILGSSTTTGALSTNLSANLLILPASADYYQSIVFAPFASVVASSTFDPRNKPLRWYANTAVQDDNGSDLTLTVCLPHYVQIL